MQQADEMGLTHRPHGHRHRQRRARRRAWSSGWRACNAGIPVLGIGVRAPKDRQEANVHRLAEATADYVGVRGGIAACGGGGELRLCRPRLRPADRQA